MLLQLRTDILNLKATCIKRVLPTARLIQKKEIQAIVPITRAAIIWMTMTKLRRIAVTLKMSNKMGK